MVAYGEEHARQLTGLAGRIGSTVVISSGAVYEDARGRSFDTQDEPDGAPQYPVPIPETQATVALVREDGRPVVPVRPPVPVTQSPTASEWRAGCTSRPARRSAR